VGTQPILDIEGLLSPIDDAAPCGSDPRSDPSPVSPYQKLKDARRAAADAERNLERGFGEDSDAKNAEEAAKKSWNLIGAEGPPLIQSVAKDLEIAAWLTEALLRLHRLGGLRDGLLLTVGLVERHWDGLFPLPDEDGLETRLLPIAGLSGGEAEGRLIAPLKKLPLTEGEDSDAVPFWQYENAAAGDGGGAAFATALQRSSPQFVRNLVDDAQACLKAVVQLEAALDAQCGAETPSFSRLREVLGGIVDAVKGHAAAMLESEIDDAPAPEPGAELPTEAAEPSARGRALDRQAAFRQLEEVAAFFRRTEPHSPIAYAIENLVRRGRLTFPELVEELIADGNVRRDYFINAGIQPPADGPKS
jgi:type VI secretion system protein ImpA